MEQKSEPKGFHDVSGLLRVGMVAARAPVSRERLGASHVKIYDLDSKPDRLVVIFDESVYDREVAR